MNRGSILIQNACVVLPGKVTPLVSILIENGRIKDIGSVCAISNCQQMDVKGSYVFPGFIDVHVHGGGGADFMDATPEAFETVVKAHLKHGTTTLVPTALTAPKEELISFVQAYQSFKANSNFASLAQGIHFEGPYFSKSNILSKWAQDASSIRDIDFKEMIQLIGLAKGDIVRWDAAPEVPGSDRFAQLMHEHGIICAVAHTDATADEAQKAYSAGFSHVTHFYNAVTAYKKRDQLVTAGVVEATYLDESVTVELICDGKHIPKQCLQLALQIKGPDKVIGITDAMRISCTTGGGFAVPAFNVYNLETVLGVMNAAEESGAPVIFQMYSRLLDGENAQYVAPIIMEAIKNMRVPAAFHLDHGAGVPEVLRALRYGATGIMIDASTETLDKNIEKTKEVVAMCGEVGVSVEGELGHVGATKEEIGIEYTKVDEAVRYVHETGVSALAIIVGTAHGHYKQAPVLNIERIENIHKAVNAHLVLHGGSGVPDDQIRASIDAGIRKINFSTDLCCAFMNTVRNVDSSIVAIDLAMRDPINAVKEFALSKIKLLGADK